MAMVQQTIEDGGGDHGIAEHGAPFTDAAIILQALAIVTI